jgi:hypothetical protein
MAELKAPEGYSLGALLAILLLKIPTHNGVIPHL